MAKYSLLMRVFHWTTGIMIISLLGFGLWMSNLPNDYPNKFSYYDTHKSLGMILLALVLLRLVNRLLSSVPLLPNNIPKSNAWLSQVSIIALYLCMVAMPIFGYLMSNFAGYQVKIFGTDVPMLFNPNPVLGMFFNQAHRFTGFVLIGLIVLHLMGTLKHYLIDKINLLARMW